MGTGVEAGAPVGWLRRIVIGRNPKWTLIRIVIWVAVLLLGSRFVLLPVRIEGPSMLPTYRSKGVNAVNRLAYLFHEPRRGDIVAIKLAGAHVMYLKRIIALPGETIAFHRGQAVINGEVLEERYVKFPCRWESPPVQMDWNEYYVIGDNRSMEFEGHTKGKAWRSQILGKVLL